MSGQKKPEQRSQKQERYAVSFRVSLTWEEKAGVVRRINGRCIDISPEGMRVETRDRLTKGTAVLVSSDDFGRMGLATVRHVQRDKMVQWIGLRFGAAFGLGDPARRKILERVLRKEDPQG